MQQSEISNVPQDIERISFFGYQSFIFTLVRALTISIGSYLMFKISQVDTHISTLIGFLIALIPFAMFMTISKNKDKLDILDLNTKLFGKFFGNILNMILNVVFAFLGILILDVITQYIDIQYIPDTSSIYVKILIMMPVIYAATKNIATIARISQMVLFINLGIFVLSLFGLVSEFSYYNLLPVFSMDIKSVLHSSLIFALSISTPIFLMTIIPQNKVVKKEYSKKKVLTFFTLSVLSLAIVIVTTILILGIDVINIYRYPIYMALRQFSIFTIIERLERFLSLQFLADVMIYLILTVYFVSVGLKRVIKIKKKENYFSIFVGIVILLLAIFIFKDTVMVNKLIEDYYMYILLFGILVPVSITYIGVLVDNVKSKLSNKEYKST